VAKATIITVVVVLAFIAPELLIVIIVFLVKKINLPKPHKRVKAQLADENMTIYYEDLPGDALNEPVYKNYRPAQPSASAEHVELLDISQYHQRQYQDPANINDVLHVETQFHNENVSIHYEDVSTNAACVCTLNDSAYEDSDPTQHYASGEVTQLYDNSYRQLNSVSDGGSASEVIFHYVGLNISYENGLNEPEHGNGSRQQSVSAEHVELQDSPYERLQYYNNPVNEGSSDNAYEVIIRHSVRDEPGP